MRSRGWSQEQRDAAAERMRARWASGEHLGRRPKLRLVSSRSVVRNSRRFTDHKPVGEAYALPDDHPAALHGTTLFLKRRLAPAKAPTERLLKSGANNRKIGARVLKGRLAGFPIYTLTLEERATCPRSCQHWLDCFGNKMNWPTRWTDDATLADRLRAEIAGLSWLHPKGFLVRLHVLGDFYSLAYVALWIELLIRHPALHVYGYTAHPPASLIGMAIASLSKHHWRRFAMRFSNGGESERCAVTKRAPKLRGTTAEGTVCPVESGDSDSCGSCALCWQSQRNIIFLLH
jgi:hypothetical protein